jgi:preprotein translocase subunit YajC
MPNSSSPWSTLILIALMVVAFYLLIIRPQKKRAQAQVQTMSSLVPGARVLLTSGIFGSIVSVGTKQAVIELAPGVELTVVKQAIARLASEADDDTIDDLIDDDLDDDDRDVEPEPPTGTEPTTRKE